jgi:hypothetical protein
MKIVLRSLASDPLQRVVEEKLHQWTQMQLLNSANPAADALSFFDLVLAGVVSRTLYGVEQIKTPRQIKLRVGHAVGLFVHGIASSR